MAARDGLPGITMPNALRMLSMHSLIKGLFCSEDCDIPTDRQTDGGTDGRSGRNV